MNRISTSGDSHCWHVKISYFNIWQLYLWVFSAPFLSFFNLFIFNWRIIVLQYYVGFYQTPTRINHRFTHAFLHFKTYHPQSKVQTIIHIQFSHSVTSDPLRLHKLQHAQASLSITKSLSPPKLMSIESVMPSNHLILCHPLLLLPSIFPHQGIFKWVSSSHQVAKVLEFQLQHQSFQWTPRTDLL